MQIFPFENRLCFAHRKQLTRTRVCGAKDEINFEFVDSVIDTL